MDLVCTECPTRFYNLSSFLPLAVQLLSNPWSEKVDLGAILARMRFFEGEIVWRRQRHQLYVMVCEQLGRLFIGPLVAVRAQSCLVNDMIRDVLCMFN